MLKVLNKAMRKLGFKGTILIGTIAVASISSAFILINRFLNPLPTNSLLLVVVAGFGFIFLAKGWGMLKKVILRIIAIK